MAKIIVTQHGCPFENLVRRIVETDEWVIEESQTYQGKTRLKNDKGDMIVEESLDEILKLIQESESQGANKKLDEILKTLKDIDFYTSCFVRRV